MSVLWHTSESRTPRLDAFCWSILAISFGFVGYWIYAAVEFVKHGGLR